MKLGIIGYDTTHCAVFTQKIRALAEANPRYKDLEIVFGWPGDPETAVHPEILEKVRGQMDNLNIQTLDSLEAVVDASDGILLESVNGDTHLEQAKMVLPSGKPTYIDKPFANTAADAYAIADLAVDHGTPCWSASSLRYEPNMRQAMEEAGQPFGMDVYGPAKYFEKGRGVVYYGIHTAEMLFTVMGTGIQSVQTFWHEDWEFIVGTWSDGRIGTLRADRKTIARFGGVIHGDQANTSAQFLGTGDFYGAMAEKLAEFFVSQEPPVTLDETVQIISFLDAAVQSAEDDGAVIEFEYE
jgi:predicted dehydrogenase